MQSRVPLALVAALALGLPLLPPAAGAQRVVGSIPPGTRGPIPPTRGCVGAACALLEFPALAPTVLAGGPEGAALLAGILGLPAAAIPLVPLAADPSAGLSAILAPEQQALLGCGPYWGTNCDRDGIDLLDARTSVLLQSWPGASSELAALSYNFQMLLVALSSSPGQGPPGGSFDPNAPYAAGQCSFVTPQYCSSVAALFGPSVRPGGNASFGRRDFVWHGYGRAARRVAIPSRPGCLPPAKGLAALSRPVRGAPPSLVRAGRCPAR